MNRTILMRKVLAFFLFLCVSLLIFAGRVSAEQPLPTTRTLEGLVAKWVDLRREIASEEQVWQEQKGYLEQEYKLLLKEKKLLEEEIVEAEEEKSSYEAERAGLFQDKESFQKALNGSLPALSRAEAVLKKWKMLLPPSPAISLNKLFARLEKANQYPVSRRFQLILSLYGEIERLQYSVNVGKEVLKTDSEKEQEFEVIYLGLAQAYCVSGDGKLAGIGKPAEDGWKWQWRPEIAKEVRRGIEFYKHEKIAGFVKLPLRIDAQ